MEKVCGIYSITNIINGKLYIGSSCDIERRWKEHIRMLNNNNHHSHHLQQAWNYYKQENFLFDIIEKCSEDELLNKEQYYIDLYNSFDSYFGYNISPFAGKPYSTEEQRIKVALLNSENNKGENNCCAIYTEKQIIELINDLKLGEYSHIQLARKHNISYDTVASIVRHKSWKYLTENIIFPIPKLNTRENVKLTENDVIEIINLILQGKGNNELCDLYNVAPHTISDIRNYKTWKYLTDGLIFPKVRRNKSFGNEKSKLSESQVKKNKNTVNE